MTAPRERTVPWSVRCAAVWTAAALALGACVTERSKPTTGIRFPSTSAGGSPENPISRAPQGASTAGSRAVFAIKPLGMIPSDGLTLPLISPDGRSIAVQHGLAPSWASILAEPGQGPESRTRLSIWEIDPDAGTLRAQAPRSGLPQGLLLGRGADDVGFLVESPRHGGVRWIGRVPWKASEGGVEWLVDDAADSAHAVLSPGGVLAYTRRAAGSDAGRVLVIRLAAAKGGEEHVVPLDGATVQHPVLWRDGPENTSRPRVGAIVIDLSGRMTLRALGTSATGAWSFEPTPLLTLALRADPMEAYQSIAGMDPHFQNGRDARLVLFSPAEAAAVLFEPASGQAMVLAEGAFAATILKDAPSGPMAVWTTQSGLRTAAMGAGQSSRLADDPLVPRLVEGGSSRMIAFGPAGSPQTPAMAVYALQPTAPINPDAAINPLNEVAR